MLIFKPLLISNLILLGFSFSLFADNIAYRVFSLSTPINELVYFSGEKRLELNIPSHRRSKTYKYSGAREIAFYDQSVKEITEDTQPITTAVIPENVNNPLLVFFKNKNKKQYKVFVYDDSLTSLKAGSGRFINLSHRPLVLLLGDTDLDKVSVPPLESRTMQFKEKSLNLRIRIANVVDASLNKAMDSRIFPLPTHRDLYFIYPVEGKANGLVRLKILRENQITAQRAFK